MSDIKPLQKEQLRMTSFTELPLSSALQQRLAAAQFTIPTPIQAQAIQAQGGAAYIQLKALEKWDGKLPQIVGGSAPVPFIQVASGAAK